MPHFSMIALGMLFQLIHRPRLIHPVQACSTLDKSPLILGDLDPRQHAHQLTWDHAIVMQAYTGPSDAVHMISLTCTALSEEIDLCSVWATMDVLVHANDTSPTPAPQGINT